MFTVNPEEPSLEPVYILLISISTGAILLCCLLIILLPKAKAKWNKWCRRERYVDDIVSIYFSTVDLLEYLLFILYTLIFCKVCYCWAGSLKPMCRKNVSGTIWREGFSKFSLFLRHQKILTFALPWKSTGISVLTCSLYQYCFIQLFLSLKHVR